MEIALTATLSADTGSPSQRFQNHFIQALALFLCASAESGIHGSRYFPNCVLHALIVGHAGTKCKQIDYRKGQIVLLAELRQMDRIKLLVLHPRELQKRVEVGILATYPKIWWVRPYVTCICLRGQCEMDCCS